MNKGRYTRDNIIAQAATLFNTRGYAGASMAELMQVTGLKKGGIYNHFKSKEEILLSAFEYSLKTAKDKLRTVIEDKPGATEKLIGIIEYYRYYPLNPVIKGGCPILNSIVDSDNTDSVLKERAKLAVEDMIWELERIIAYGIRRGEFKQDVDAYKTAVFIFTAIEGGVAITRGQEDNRIMEIVSDQLLSYVDKELRQ